MLATKMGPDNRNIKIQKYDLQKLSRALLQADQGIQQPTVHEIRNEGNGKIDNGERNSLNKRVVQSPLLMSANNWPLRKQGWDLSHGHKSREEEGA